MEFASGPHIISSVDGTWSSLLGTKASATNVDSNNNTPNYMTGIVHISGEWLGAVVISFDQKSANQVASSMYSIPAEEIPLEDLTDAIGEISNFVGGNLKMALSGMNNLSLPSVIRGDQYNAYIHSGHLINSVLFESADGFFKVSVYSEESNIH